MQEGSTKHDQCQRYPSWFERIVNQCFLGADFLLHLPLRPSQSWLYTLTLQSQGNKSMKCAEPEGWETPDEPDIGPLISGDNPSGTSANPENQDYSAPILLSKDPMMLCTDLSLGSIQSWDRWVIPIAVRPPQSKWAPTSGTKRSRGLYLESFSEKLKEIWKQELIQRILFIY